MGSVLILNLFLSTGFCIGSGFFSGNHIGNMKEGKSAKLNHQDHLEQIHHQNSHLGSFKFAKLFDSEASWDKVQLLQLRPLKLISLSSVAFVDQLYS